MSVHLVKLSVGTDGIDDLAAWQAERLRAMKAAGEKRPMLYHRTFQTPKRRDDLLDGGCMYWVIKGVIQARQKLVDLREGTKDDGSPCCLLMLDPTLTPVRPVPRRPFQGWRYLDAADAPPDLKPGESGIADLPPKMRRELAELGLI